VLGPNSIIGNYRLLRLGGVGGMGEVWQAEDTTGAKVALKLLRPELTGDEAAAGRFVQEAHVMEAMVHRHILRVLHVGEDDGRLYFVMEWVEGGTLGEKLNREGALPLREARVLLAQMIEGLSYAADRGVIHRDVKPANVLLKWGTDVKIADFGIAKFLGADNRRLAGIAMGSPYYMSPEAVLGKDVDVRSDIYSLGITLYQMLTTEVPFKGSNVQAVLKQHLDSQLPDYPGMSRLAKGALLPTLRKMTAKRPEDRFQSYDDLQFALTSLAEVSEQDAPLAVVFSRQPEPSQQQEIAPSESVLQEVHEEDWGHPTVAADVAPLPPVAPDEFATFRVLEVDDSTRAAATWTISNQDTVPLTAALTGSGGRLNISGSAAPKRHVVDSLVEATSETRLAVKDAVKGGRSAVTIAAILGGLAILVIGVGVVHQGMKDKPKVAAQTLAPAPTLAKPALHGNAVLASLTTASITSEQLDSSRPRVTLDQVAEGLLHKTPPEVVAVLGAPDFSEITEISGALFYTASAWKTAIIDEQTSRPVARLKVVFQRDRCVMVSAD